MQNHKLLMALAAASVFVLNACGPTPTETPSPTVVTTPVTSAPRPTVTPSVIPVPTPAALASPLQSPVATPATQSPVYYGYEIVAAYPHDPEAFTQGLVFDAGVFYESTGLNGRSSLRKVDVNTGNVLQKRDVAEQYFAEGLVLVDQRLIQLTWQSNIGFIYDKSTFEPTGTFSYTSEGWGLTYDGAQLILSDGSPVLRYLDPQTFEVQRAITVTDRGQPVVRLNELEYVRGEIFANVWQTDLVARIDPTDGHVLGWIDFSGLLLPTERQNTDVLNGIAYDPASDRMFITGKLWPKVFEIKLVQK